MLGLVSRTQKGRAWERERCELTLGHFRFGGWSGAMHNMQNVNYDNQLMGWDGRPNDLGWRYSEFDVLPHLLVGPLNPLSSLQYHSFSFRRLHPILRYALFVSLPRSRSKLHPQKTVRRRNETESDSVFSRFFRFSLFSPSRLISSSCLFLIP